ncbi:MAG: hypothetical protein IPJ20_12785 [Flammeovirgaceae bacterium]|jgi:hypothetical protein|nr:hypothetical protein [Flammeovirgaceae bacterium]
MTTKKKYNFITPTLKFCIAGFFIPGFTAIIIMGLQMGLGLLGIECSNTWKILWTFTAIGAVITPFIFIRVMNKRLLEGYNLTTDKLQIFNLVEYTFIQCTLTIFFTTGQTLCYVSDGQNGIEFGFTAWMALPILVALSLVFDNLRERKTDKIKADRAISGQ